MKKRKNIGDRELRDFAAGKSGAKSCGYGPFKFIEMLLNYLCKLFLLRSLEKVALMQKGNENQQLDRRGAPDTGGDAWIHFS